MDRIYCIVASISMSLCCACRSEIENRTDSFGGYNIPNYFQEQILEKENKITELLSGRDNVSSFIFFTDAHWEINSRMSPRIMRHIQNTTGIDNVFFGGDAINGSTNKKEALIMADNFIDAFSDFKSFYPVFGNHDSNKITANLKDPSKWFSDDEVYNYLHGRLSADPNVHYGSFFYYYVDDLSNHTRFFCLDSGRSYISIDEVKFVAEALTALPDGWHVAFVTHIAYNASDLYDPSTIYLHESIKPMAQIADAYNARTIFKIDDQAMYDFSTATGRIDFIMGGHIHRDYIGHTEGGIPVIALDCDCLYTYSPVGNKRGTINEQCITVVVSDYDNDEIHLIRFGRGGDITIKDKRVRK